MREASQAALKATCGNFYYINLVQTTMDLLHRLKDINIHLEWLKAHIGVSGNEDVDKGIIFSTSLIGHKNLGKSKGAVYLLLRDNRIEIFQ